MKKNQKAFDLETFLSTVNGGRRVATYRKGETVFAQGDRCEGVFYIQSGECKVCVTSKQGKEAVVALRGKGDFFGEGCLNGQPLRLATGWCMASGAAGTCQTSRQSSLKYAHPPMPSRVTESG
jgi:CRP-like cAMP-binding protein